MIQIKLDRLTPEYEKNNRAHILLGKHFPKYSFYRVNEIPERNEQNLWEFLRLHIGRPVIVMQHKEFNTAWTTGRIDKCLFENSECNYFSRGARYLG